MVCLAVLSIHSNSNVESISCTNDGPRRQRMQQSSSGTRPRAEGNKYTAFPTSRTNGSSSAGFGHPDHAIPCPAPVPLSEHNGTRRTGHDSRQRRVQHLQEPRRQTCNPLLSTSIPPLPAPSTPTPSENRDSCTLVTFYNTPPSLNSRPPSSTSSDFLPLYRRLPEITSEVDLDRLGRTMRGLQEGRFYYPDLDSDGARRMLRQAPEGTFLVRDSSDPRYLFSVSVKTARGATSVRIQYYKGVFQLDCDENMRRKLPRFETLLDLLDFHVTACQEENGGRFRWQESSQRMDLVINLSSPRRHSPPSLAHLARVVVNRDMADRHLPAGSTDRLPVPDGVKQLLRDYPFKV